MNQPSEIKNILNLIKCFIFYFTHETSFSIFCSRVIKNSIHSITRNVNWKMNFLKKKEDIIEKYLTKKIRQSSMKSKNGMKKIIFYNPSIFHYLYSDINLLFPFNSRSITERENDTYTNSKSSSRIYNNSCIGDNLTCQSSRPHKYVNFLFKDKNKIKIK